MLGYSEQMIRYYEQPVTVVISMINRVGCFLCFVGLNRQKSNLIGLDVDAVLI